MYIIIYIQMIQILCMITSATLNVLNGILQKVVNLNDEFVFVKFIINYKRTLKPVSNNELTIQ